MAATPDRTPGEERVFVLFVKIWDLGLVI
ncbi:hypothetical protein SCA6_019276 [Theobroma cacao]